MGFSFSGAAPNQGLMFAALKPFDERQRRRASRPGGPRPSAGRAVRHSRRARHAVRAAGDPGLGAFGGFEFEVLDQSGGDDIENLAGATQAIVGAGNRVAASCAGLFSSFTANDPQLAVDIDREQGARRWACRSSEITDALQIFLGSQYVNDFDFNNRAYRVYVQADQPFRVDPKALQPVLRAHATRPDGAARQRRATLSETTAPQVISHFNLFRSAEINGSAAPGVSSGAGACRRWSGWRRRALPQGFGYAWSGISLEEIEGRAASRCYIFGLGAPARVPDAGGAVRDLRAAVHRPARRAARRARRAVGAVAARAAATTLTARSASSC